MSNEPRQQTTTSLLVKGFVAAPLLFAALYHVGLMLMRSLINAP